MTALTPVYTRLADRRAGADPQRRLQAAARARAIELLSGRRHSQSGRVGRPLSPSALGGMRQRAVIAMALSCNPSLLIADDATTALDVTVQARSSRLIQKLRRDFGSAVV